VLLTAVPFLFGPIFAPPLDLRRPMVVSRRVQIYYFNRCFYVILPRRVQIYYFVLTWYRSSRQAVFSMSRFSDLDGSGRFPWLTSLLGYQIFKTRPACENWWSRRQLDENLIYYLLLNTNIYLSAGSSSHVQDWLLWAKICFLMDPRGTSTLVVNLGSYTTLLIDIRRI
jgi:hypothetical protein